VRSDESSEVNSRTLADAASVSVATSDSGTGFAAPEFGSSAVLGAESADDPGAFCVTAAARAVPTAKTNKQHTIHPCKNSAAQ
jgi:hypothetical protein